ncbi:MAG: CCA tRNA nucleotidyltransferase [Clostridiales bacterium]|jgi:tRNA nucleotidyltransferase (CCA-adding enzyme)|nr:CCA tRNA nucleotidyltransferase [Clostridiales bacterium]
MPVILPANVKFIIDALYGAGFEAYAVGGCVRDRLLGAEPKDWDIATSATPAQVKEIFRRTVDTGIKHGTVTVLLERCAYEVTTYRVDGAYLDGRRPSEVTFASRIGDDLSRRDFTMNAIAYNGRDGFVDPFGGAEDIKNKIIRCVGEASQRFNEDALRMLRAVRFASQLGFEIEPQTLSAIQPLARKLALISAERIREELTKLLLGARPQALCLFRVNLPIQYVLFGREYPGDMLEKAAQIAACPKVTALVYALFLLNYGAESVKILRDLRFDNKTAREISEYIRLLPPRLENDSYAIKKNLRGLSADHFFKLLTLKEILEPEKAAEFHAIRAAAEGILARGECFSIRQLAVNGDDLIAAGIADGKAVGAALESLLDRVLRDPSANTRARLLTEIPRFARNDGP